MSLHTCILCYYTVHIGRPRFVSRIDDYGKTERKNIIPPCVREGVSVKTLTGGLVTANKPLPLNQRRSLYRAFTIIEKPKETILSLPV